jgi:hypothetical protein
VTVVRTDVSEESIISNIRVLKMGELGKTTTANAVPTSPNHFNLMMEAIRSSETSSFTTVERHAIPENSIL